MKQKIIPAEFPDKNSTDVALSKVSITYVQEPDDQSGPDAFDQEITIETQANGACWGTNEILEGEDPFFYTIKTERWAFDDEEELLNIIQDFRKRVFMGLDGLRKEHKETQEQEEC